MVNEEDTMSFQTAAATPQIGNGHHDALVLADAGDDLWLVRAKFDSPPDIGTHFSFQGIEWLIAWSCEQGFGARPVAPIEGTA
jgi:hypothetical protein